jgi:hypothetical protein
MEIVRTHHINAAIRFKQMADTTAQVQVRSNCDTASLISRARSIKSTGSVEKDMAELLDLAKAIQSTAGSCRVSSPRLYAEYSTGTRRNPIPVGYFFTFVAGEITFSLGITQAFRGKEAYQRVMSGNALNNGPESGKEYLLLYVEVDYLEGPEDDLLKTDRGDFTPISNGQVLPAYQPGIAPTPHLDMSLFPGATGKGWVLKHVFPDDPNPLVVVGNTPNSADGFYFATQIY